MRRIIRQRQLRARFFDGELFADPAWDILLDLTAARVEHTRVSVTSLCIASGVPPTTALRWIAQMRETGLVERVEDESDKRRAFISLTDKAADGMARFLQNWARTRNAWFDWTGPVWPSAPSGDGFFYPATHIGETLLNFR